MGMHEAAYQTPAHRAQAQFAVEYFRKRLKSEPGDTQEVLNSTALQYVTNWEYCLHAVAFEVFHLGGNRWEVLRYLEDESVWMQSLEVGPFSDTDQRSDFYWNRPEFTREQQVIQAAIVSSYKFKLIE